MRFDSSATTQNGICRSLSLDPRMIRFSVLKMADRLGTRGHVKGLEDVGGKVEWQVGKSWQDQATLDFVGRHSQRAGKKSAALVNR